MDLTELRKVAGLCRVKLGEAEEKEFIGQFKDILSYFESIQGLPDAKASKETTSRQALREDVVGDSIPREIASNFDSKRKTLGGLKWIH
ncbi:MAG TPA: Asp-tRNA(Asn)/Glu-tRNA(Gln) amidotransferase subunit GatC [archaeon]|nr:Asp-tRNA(Asn)/Glu-tRNA(Gln) amidotransferase subunit GatC [archaeon]